MCKLLPLSSCSACAHSTVTVLQARACSTNQDYPLLPDGSAKSILGFDFTRESVGGTWSRQLPRLCLFRLDTFESQYFSSVTGVCVGVWFCLFVCFCDSHASLSLVRPIVSVMRLALKSDQQWWHETELGDTYRTKSIVFLCFQAVCKTCANFILLLPLSSCSTCAHYSVTVLQARAARSETILYFLEAPRRAFWVLIFLESPWVEPDLDSCLALVYLDWTSFEASILSVSRVVKSLFPLSCVVFNDIHVHHAFVGPIVYVKWLALRSRMMSSSSA